MNNIEKTFQDYLDKAPDLVRFCREGKLLNGTYRGDSQVIITYDTEEADRLSWDDTIDGYEY